MARPDQFVVITDPGTPLEQLASDDGLRRCFLNPADIGGRYSVLSYFGLVPAALMGVNIEALLHRCQVAEQMCAHYDSSESNSGLWFGADDRRAGAPGPRQADVRDLAADRELRAVGRAARGRVDRQARTRDRPGRRRAAQRFGRRLRRRSGVRLPAQPRAARGASRRRDRAARRRRASDDHAAGARPGRPRADLLPDRVRGRRGRVGARDQPVRPAERAGGQGQHGAGAWNPVLCPTLPVAADDDALRALLADARPPHYVAILGYLPPSSELEEAVGGAAQRDPFRDRRGDDVWLWSALPALDRPAAQGRAADGSVPAAGERPRARRRDPRRRLLVRNADRRAGGRRPRDAASARAVGASG